MKAIAKVRAVGGSLMVTIPKQGVEVESIREGDVVTLEVEKGKKDFFGIFRGIGPFKQEDEMKAHE